VSFLDLRDTVDLTCSHPVSVISSAAKEDKMWFVFKYVYTKRITWDLPLAFQLPEAEEGSQWFFTLF